MKSKFYLGLLGILSLLSKMRSKETDFLENIGIIVKSSQR
jgi:hypothetical protein